MKKHLLLGAVGLLSLPVAANAANWVRVDSGPKGEVVYIDTNSVRAIRGLQTAWVKWDFSKVISEKARSSLVLYELNCGDITIQPKSWTDYAPNGDVVRFGRARPYVDVAQAVIPESVGESIYNAVCS